MDNSDIRYCIWQLQRCLNRNGFTDAEGNRLVLDGVCGPKFVQAMDKYNASRDAGPSEYGIQMPRKGRAVPRQIWPKPGQKRQEPGQERLRPGQRSQEPGQERQRPGQRSQEQWFGETPVQRWFAPMQHIQAPMQGGPDTVQGWRAPINVQTPGQTGPEKAQSVNAGEQPGRVYVRRRRPANNRTTDGSGKMPPGGEPVEKEPVESRQAQKQSGQEKEQGSPGPEKSIPEPVPERIEPEYELVGSEIEPVQKEQETKKSEAKPVREEHVTEKPEPGPAQVKPETEAKEPKPPPKEQGPGTARPEPAQKSQNAAGSRAQTIPEAVSSYIRSNFQGKEHAIGPISALLADPKNKAYLDTVQQLISKDMTGILSIFGMHYKQGNFNNPDDPASGIWYSTKNGIQHLFGYEDSFNLLDDLLGFNLKTATVLFKSGDTQFRFEVWYGLYSMNILVPGAECGLYYVHSADSKGHYRALPPEMQIGMEVELYNRATSQQILAVDSAKTEKDGKTYWQFGSKFLPGTIDNSLLNMKGRLKDADRDFLAALTGAGRQSGIVFGSITQDQATGKYAVGYTFDALKRRL